MCRELANQLAAEFPQIIKEVRGWGLICGIELADDCGITAADITAKLMSAGVLVVPAGPKVVRFVPPLIISQQEVQSGLEQVKSAVRDLIASASR